MEQQEEALGLQLPVASAADRDGGVTQRGGCLRCSNHCSKSGWWWSCVGCPPRSQLHCVACQPGATHMCLSCVLSMRGLGFLPTTFWGVR